MCLTATGAVYPCFGVVFAKGIDAFAQEPRVRRKEGDRVALWFVVAILFPIQGELTAYR